jgi:hypothetical protein
MPNCKHGICSSIAGSPRQLRNQGRSAKCRSVLGGQQGRSDHCACVGADFAAAGCFNDCRLFPGKHRFLPTLVQVAVANARSMASIMVDCNKESKLFITFTVLLSGFEEKNFAATKLPFPQFVQCHGLLLNRITAYQLQSYGAAGKQIMPNVEHCSHNGLNNFTKNSSLNRLSSTRSDYSDFHKLVPSPRR